MGNFFAHVFPGSIFLFLGWWYYVNYLLSFHRKRVFVHQNVHSRTIEPLLKIMLCIIGMSTECYSSKWTFLVIEEESNTSADWQHFTMYFIFAISAACDLICARYREIGKTIVYMTYIAAYLLESALFFGHLHDRSVVDKQCHMLISQSGLAVSVTLTYILFNQTSIVAASLYSFLLISHGIWFIEAGFILLSPFPNLWDLENPDHAMMSTVIFCWTLVAVFAVMGVIAIAIDKYYKGVNQNRPRQLRMEELDLLSSD